MFGKFYKRPPTKRFVVIRPVLSGGKKFYAVIEVLACLSWTETPLEYFDTLEEAQLYKEENKCLKST